MGQNPLLQLQGFGQSIWLDFIRRHMITSGELQRLIAEDGLRGVTSNPSIFEKAIGGSHDYDAAIRELANAGKSAQEIYEALTVEDIQMAADLFRPVYDRLQGSDGFVSLEVSPHLAHDTEGTIAEARRLWQLVDRPNVLIKVPATKEGLPAIRQLISEGINVNVTLLFGLPRYHEVTEAYLGGLEARVGQSKPVDKIASVASFFLSRITVLVDPLLDEMVEDQPDVAELARRLRGQIAIASAKVAYEMYEDIFATKRFSRLAAHGAHPQRLLWASTSTKNPQYSDVKYVEALIGPKTVNTIPLETLNAYRDHGHPAPRLKEGRADAYRMLQQLHELGIDIDAVTRQLEGEGVKKFVQPFDRLMDTLEKERRAALEEPVDRENLQLGAYEAAVHDCLADLEETAFARRLWRKDTTLWKQDPGAKQEIRHGLGWLHVAEKMVPHLNDLNTFVEEVKAAGFDHVVHMGMGGSSLAPLVFQRTLAPTADGLPLTVLDTTDPATILGLEHHLPLAQTLFIVASKSGTTAETRAFADTFYARLRAGVGDKAGANFVAITDPGTPLMELALQRDFRRIFLNFADIGGRYSALSYFGLVPLALLGVDVSDFLHRALRMVYACDAPVPTTENPGLMLGAALGELAQYGRDKVTFITSPALSPLGMWLEQLLAESTGKEGKGLLPVAAEPLGVPGVYGDDRVFVYLRLVGVADEALAARVDALQTAGHPVITIDVENELDLGQEFFRWEVATATAGALLGINAFNQPNVQESKENTNRLLRLVSEQGLLPTEPPALREGPLQLYASDTATDLTTTLTRFLDQAHPGDYVALMAYLTESDATTQALQGIRRSLRDRLHVATTLGYGPRFLHSTGQFHKGGPDTGLFLQLTADEGEDANIPGRPYSFGALRRAQAQGDLQALRQHGRRVVRLHLGSDVQQGLVALADVLEAALLTPVP